MEKTYQIPPIEQVLEERRKLLLSAENRAEQRLRRAPEGSLRTSLCKGSTQYYWRKKSSEYNGIYIPKKKRNLAARLAQKNYDKKLIEAIREETGSIDSFLESRFGQRAEQVYKSLSDARKELVTPGVETDEQFVERWLSEPYEMMGFEEGAPELFTDRGIRVRSKSELIIANQFDKDTVPFLYEYPLWLNDFKMLRPDFKVLNVRLRKTFYWEHLGMMDDPDYVERAIQKFGLYNKNGYYIGDTLLVTFENKKTPLDARGVKEMIDRFLK